MSGPKTSRFVLSVEQRSLIEKQQRIIRETKVAQERRNAILFKAKSNLDNLSAIILEFEQLCNEYKQGLTDLQNIKHSYNDLFLAVNNKMYQVVGVALEEYREQYTSLDNLVSKTRNDQIKIKQILERIKSKFNSELENTIDSGFKLDFVCLGTDRKYDSIPGIKKIDNALKKVIGIELSDNLKDRLEILRKRASEITNVDFLENFYSVQVHTFVSECILYMEHEKEYEELLYEYLLLSEEVGVCTKKYEFSMQAIDELKQDIAILETKILLAKEQEYIRVAIDESMQEMGYELVGNRNVVKKSGIRFRNGLYQFDKGTAVNVTFADNGQISMELGALDVKNRLPTDIEALELADDMRAFCDDYLELEEKLEQKGVISNRISILPPAVEYAQVFDISDYEILDSIELHKQKKNKKHLVKLHKEGF